MFQPLVIGTETDETYINFCLNTGGYLKIICRTQGEVIIGEYSPIITEPAANNCFSINTQVIISKKRKKKTFQHEIIFTYNGKTTTGSHFVHRGDYWLIIRDSEPMRARDFV